MLFNAFCFQRNFISVIIEKLKNKVFKQKLIIKNMTTLDEGLKQIIATELQLSDKVSQKINKDTRIKDLGADSLDFLEILMKIEEQYNVSIPDEKTDQLNNFGELCGYVSKHPNYKPEYNDKPFSKKP